jgi:hypothetical protein
MYGEKLRREFLLAADRLSVALILVLGAYLVFYLPYSFPPALPTLDSLSYQVGFGNRVAILGVIAVIGLLCLRGLLWRQSPPVDVDSIFVSFDPDACRRHPAMPKSVLFVLAGTYVGLASLMFLCLPQLGDFGEAQNYLLRVQLGLHYHLHPYSGMSWPYGPALFYFPVWVIAMTTMCGGSIDLGYLITYLILSCLGLWGIFYFIDHIRVKVVYRVVAFTLVAIGSYQFGLGIATGLALRYIAPFVLLMLLHGMTMPSSSTEEQGGPSGASGRRALIRLIVLPLVLAWVALSISIDVGLAYIVSQGAYSVHRAIFRRRAWWWAVLVTGAAFPAWLLVFPNYTMFFRDFTAGAADLPILPGAHILIYLTGISWLVPFLACGCLARRPSENVPLVLGVSLLCMATIPPALGRCEYAHVALNGVGPFALTLALLARHRKGIYPVYAILFLIVFGIVQRFTEAASPGATGFQPLRAALGGHRMLRAPANNHLVEDLNLDKYAAIAAPLGIDQDTRDHLIESKRLADVYYPNPWSLLSPMSLERKLQGLKEVQVVLVPEWVPTLKDVSDETLLKYRQETARKSEAFQGEWLGWALFFPVHFAPKNLPFEPSLVVAKFVATNFDPVRRADGWVVMEAKKPIAAVKPDSPETPTSKGPLDSDGMPIPDTPQRPRAGPGH